jgi:hypothetical protein
MLKISSSIDMPPHIVDAGYWRDRAVKMRALSDQITDTDGKTIMLRLAKDYDWLAEWADLQCRKSI